MHLETTFVSSKLAKHIRRVTVYVEVIY